MADPFRVEASQGVQQHFPTERPEQQVAGCRGACLKHLPDELIIDLIWWLTRHCIREINVLFPQQGGEEVTVLLR